MTANGNWLRRPAAAIRLALLIGLGYAAAQLYAADAAKDDAKPAENLYAPKKGLSPAQLQEFIERRQESPAALHERPGFAEGIVEAAERIIAGKPDQAVRRMAILAEFDAWHDAGAAGNEAADKKLFALAEQFQKDSDAVGR